MAPGVRLAIEGRSASRSAREQVGFKEHELRRQVVREMHLRRFPEFALPADITQWVKLIDASEREMEHSQVLAMPAVPQQDASGHRRHVAGLGAEGLRISWERHSEASTTTCGTGGEPLRSANAVRAVYLGRQGLRPQRPG